MKKKTLWATCAGIGVLLLFVLWIRMFYVSNYTISGLSQKNGFAESEIKLSIILHRHGRKTVTERFNRLAEAWYTGQSLIMRYGAALFPARMKPRLR